VGGESATFYIGGLLEKVQNSDGIDYRHMIRAGDATIIVSRQVSGTNSVHYVTGDHLGSSAAITDSNGANPLYLSFDPFGKRRGSNWIGNPSSENWEDIAGTTRRGYTEHSMLDNLGLIHMNGRVQDPALGRFLSADPFIPDPMSTQSYNRYSYVQNNPLTLVDPSGFTDERDPSDAAQPAYWSDEWWDQEWEEWERGLQGCTTSAGGSLTEFGCMLVSAQVGMGSAIADSHAARHRNARSGGPQETLYGRETYRQGEFVCYAAGCVRADGRFTPYESGLESVSWLDPVFMLASAGLGELGCTGDCQVAASLAAGLASRSPSAVRGMATEAVAGVGPIRIYSARELVRRAAEPGPFHNFPELFNRTIFQQGTRTVTRDFWRTAKPGLSNDAAMYRLRGSVNGVEGTFEIGVRPSLSGNTEVITHRFFRPDP
jgi:RHS repeat-associated protein